ncbi:tape measure protein [Kosakonia cowanii]|uniref:tape measure protein n=1 Tax=Kosakonia cowanii TaxID=208223 RepID=UPI001122336E|nr:tape measure protein [Kosakonia cowanii]MDP9766932.1 tape measure domain-containing protein [Atlantibacter hermannii]TPD64207.1 tape measure protein [Kosakonia cowanii]TPD88539.1 tape measure protein [Kosakonia cowanii]TPE04371.1 tape measure protein [Kosakonia cowanii]
MAGILNAGKVIYEVDMDTAGILRGRREIEAALAGLGGNLGRIESSVNRTERSIASMERTLSSLGSIAKGVIAALSIQQVANYADAWTELNNKVSNSIRTGETQAEVMQRIFDISQATQSSLNGTATLYARLERGTRIYNTSAADLVRLTTIINQGFAVSGATAQEAENAIIQLSQGLAAGALRGEEYNSVAEQGSRLTNALADSLGVSIGQLRAMAAEGKLTTDVVVKGLLSQGEAIGSEFAKTTVSISKGLQVAGNNVTKFFGENATVKSFAAGFRDSVISLSENLESLGTALIGAAAIMGGRFAGALAMATVAQAQRVQGTLTAISATRQAAIQEAEAAAVTVRKTQADKGAAMSALNLALAEFQVAKNTAAEAFAMENVVRLRSAYIATAAEAAVAENALAGAQARVAATGFTMANTMKVISTVTGPLGGPLGVIAIVAAGWYLYAQRQAEARKEAIAFADTIPDVIKRLNDMNLAQSQGVRADTVDSIKAQKDSISDLKDTISGLEAEYDKYSTLARQYGVSEDENNGYVIKAREAANNLAKARRDLDGQNAKLKQTEDALHLINIRVNQGIVDQMKAARDNAIALAEAEKNATFLGGAHAILAQKLGASTQALQSFNSESLKINWGGKEGEKLIKQAKRRLELSKLEGEARARLQATYDAEDAGTKDPLAVKQLQDVYAETERATQARKDQKKEDKAAASEAKKLENQQESIAQKLSNLKQQSELAADSTRELSREQAILTAQQSLGKGATQEQIALAGKYASAKWDAANAIKAQAAAEKLLPEARENASFKQDVQDLNAALSAKKISQEQYNQTIERLEEQHQANLAKIRSDQVVSPQQEAAGGVDPVQQLANENARKLALIQQYEQQGIIAHQNALALRASADKEYEQARVAAQWEIWRNQSAGNEALAASFDALAGNASNALTGIITGSMSAEDAMRSIGNTVLNSLINSFVQMGVEWVKSAIMGQAAQTAAIGTVTAVQTAAVATQTATSTAAAATTAAAWTPAAILSSIASMGTAAAIGIGAVAGIVGMSLLGKRKNGGPVTAGGMYQVGEGGMPEIYQASTGKQYMIPGDNGKVISNKQMNAGTGGGVVINIQNYTSSTVDAQAGTDANGGVTVDVIVADINNGGPISQSISRNHQAPRRATG